MFRFRLFSDRASALFPLQFPTVDESSPCSSGAYQLILRVLRQQTLTVGRLGSIRFARGYYVYTGRAHAGIKSRLARYVRGPEKPHWHIDYVLPHAELLDIVVYPGQAAYECFLAATLSGIPGARRIRRFGASDCRCQGHLVYVGSGNAGAAAVLRTFFGSLHRVGFAENVAARTRSDR